MTRRHFRCLSCLGWAWASPNTALGLLAAVLVWAGGGRVAVHGGVLECHGGALGRWARRRARFSALTLGHVVLAASAADLAALRAHERVHVAQYARWGPFFLPAYAAASLWAWVRGGRPYRDNVFERQAYGEPSLSATGRATANRCRSRRLWRCGRP